MPTTYVDPQSVDEAHDRLLELRIAIRGIETQLNDPLREDVFSDEDEFLKWRQNTKWALTLKLQEYWRIQDWLRRNKNTA